MPRFVLLYHDCPPGYLRPSHWDFMLETGDVLRTWALPQLPGSWHEAHQATQQAFAQCPRRSETDTVAAEQLGDHRREYLQYEGDVGGNRGRVMRVAAGTYILETDGPLICRVLLDGEHIQGRLELTRADANDNTWNVTCIPRRVPGATPQ